MSQLFTWRVASRSDRRALQDFICTDPPKHKLRKPGYVKWHPREWELQVQGWIRQMDPPYRASEVALVGEKNGYLGAVVHFVDADDPCNVFIKALAVSWNLRKSPEGSSGAYGREALEAALDGIRERARAADCPGDVFVTAKIHRRNAASQRLCESFDFEPLPEVALADPELTLWQAVLSL